MSNVSDVTPYDETYTTPNQGSDGRGVLLGAVVGAAVIGCVSAIRWLVEDSEADRTSLSSMKDQCARANLDRWKNIPSNCLKTANLHLQCPDTLVKTALDLGYRLETTSLKPVEGDAVLLQGPRGQRLAIAPNSTGRLTLMSSNGSNYLDELIRQHSLDRTLEHMVRQGMQVQTARLANGEVQILARESVARAGGAAEVKAQIRNDGTAWVDVDKIRGRRCEKIVDGLANALGAKVKRTARKDPYFQLPGEPTKTKLRI